MELSKKLKNLTTLRGWKRFLKILTEKEKVVFFSSLVLFLGSLFFLFFNFYFKNTEIQPAPGGTYIEGVLGQPRFVNPVYAASSDVDRDLTELIFSGLMKYDNQGQIVPDLAESYEVKEEGKIYEVTLRKNIFWSDGNPITSDDVAFTIRIIQDSDYKSPSQVFWLGVSVEKISDSTIRFILRSPYAPFLETLTQKIIPKHVWEGISPENFPLTIYNLKPIGSGPYKLKDIKQKESRITSLELIRNPRYFGTRPYLSQITFKFYNREEELIAAYRQGEIRGFSLTVTNNLGQITLGGLNKYSFLLPRYFALFFNVQKTDILADEKIRRAFNYGTDKKEIVEKILSGQGSMVQSPVLPDIYGFSLPAENYQFNLRTAKELLDEAGFVENEQGFREKITQKDAAFQFKNDLKVESRGKEVEELQKCLAKDPEIYPEGTVSGYFGEKTEEAVIKFQEKYKDDILEPWGFEKGTGLVSKTTREKLNEICFPPAKESQPLKVAITTADQSLLVQSAQLLKEQWEKMGAQVQIEVLEINQLEREVIKPRDYEILLFGEVLTMIPDPFAFWHSSQTRDPGLNLAVYKNEKADKLLEEARKTLDKDQRKEKLEELQEIIIEDVPVVFLYNPNYLYFVTQEIKGIQESIIVNPSKRFGDIENWYIKTKRTWSKKQ